MLCALRHGTKPSPSDLCQKGGSEIRVQSEPKVVYESQLVAQAIQGDQAAQRALYDAYVDRVYRLAYRVAGDDELARDFTQEAFIRAYRKLDTFDTRLRFFSWLYRILLNECLNARRGRRPHEAITPDLLVGGDPDNIVEASERRRQVQQALLMLPHDYRAVIVLRHFAELAYDEIADTLGIPAKTVKSRLYTARQRLSELLSPQKART